MRINWRLLSLVLIATTIVTSTLVVANQSGMLGGSPVAEAHTATPHNTVHSESVIDNTLTAADLGANSVGASEIAANAVGEAEIATGAVLSSEIKDNSISAIDMNSGFISGGFKADGQGGWNPSCTFFPFTSSCMHLVTFNIQPVPNARDGSVIIATLNANQHTPAVCQVTDVYTGGFLMTCTADPPNGSFLDYIVINRAGIQP